MREHDAQCNFLSDQAPGTHARWLRLAMLAAIVALPAFAGAFDLVPVDLRRIDGGAASPPPTPVRVLVAVTNNSSVDMPAVLAASGWTVQVQGYSSNPYLVRRALRAGERYSFAITVIVPCGKVTGLEVRVNTSRALDESDFDNNRATFPVEGNACPIAVRSTLAMESRR